MRGWRLLQLSRYVCFLGGGSAWCAASTIVSPFLFCQGNDSAVTLLPEFPRRRTVWGWIPPSPPALYLSLH